VENTNLQLLRHAMFIFDPIASLTKQTIEDVLFSKNFLLIYVEKQVGGLEILEIWQGWRFLLCTLQ
jgi:hypothetical protein